VLAADVASNYVQIRSLQEQLGYTRANVKSAAWIRLLSRKSGLTRARLSDWTLRRHERRLPIRRHSFRIGRFIADKQSWRCAYFWVERHPNCRPNWGARGRFPPRRRISRSGIPADLLRRRPDVRSAERNAAALSAQIGVATADLYPAISIKGKTGYHTSPFQTPRLSPKAHNLLDANSFEGFIGLDVNWPILNYGQITNNIRVRRCAFPGSQGLLSANCAASRFGC